jgi:2-oxoglutarate/2-oxoacid ferredoxin oxidoreductase subunit beta
VARGIDVHKKLPEVLKAAYRHEGTGFVEIFQNCIVYNDDVFSKFTEKANMDDMQLWVEDGQPMLFARGTKGIALDRQALALKVVDVAGGDWEAADVIVHDVTNRAVAHMLVEMILGPFPMALGVLYDDPRPTFDQTLLKADEETAEGKVADLQALMQRAQTWEVEKDHHVI